MDNLNINDIISSLSSDDIDMLKGVASSILGGDDKSLSSASSSNSHKSTSENLNKSSAADALGSLGLDGVDFEMIMKAKSIFEKMNNTKNKNVDLIMALKPHLNKETQNKADNALRILRLFEVLPLLRELF
ncbi:MAG: hypothetical protein NC213_04240 [Acetobacter sp.]|nr:hypothetical protein [Bacteroides sp.]MCM1340934.1 hypothetical protein [Acetobacter sp.]MCM1432510.1 hypothetical protein [Clostridiales bacterium]